ncbi:MAG: DUF6468 domain-containing protein [Hyphomicrobium sp.]|nr:DUF6468 domain-containing protein [Hyphomicrobium sp.]
MTFALLLDILVALLLAVTIGYAVVLNRRLAGLRRDKGELESLAASFGQATLRAEESIGRLKKTAGELQELTAKADTIRDDLAFLIDRGSAAADRLESLVRQARGKAPPVAMTGAPAQQIPDDALEPRSDAERELMRAIRSAG